MLYLLQLEWKKVKNYSTFQILTGLYLVLLPSLLMVGKNFNHLPPELGSNQVFFMFPTVWQYLGYIGNWLAFFFLGFLSVLSVTSEFKNRTLRQNIITGLSRKQVFLAKASFIIALSLMATIYYAICALAIGFFHTETIYMSKVTQEMDLVGRYFLMCLGYTSFGMLLGLLLRRTGLTLFLYLAYVMFIELILRWMVHMNIVSNKSMHFYPMNSVEDLVPIPISDMAKSFMSENNFDFFLSPTEAVISSCVYISLFLGICYYFLMRKDL